MTARFVFISAVIPSVHVSLLGTEVPQIYGPRPLALSGGLVRNIEERVVRWLNTEQVCAELSISRRTLEKWRARGCGPRMVKLPNGSLRTREDWFEEWLAELPVDEGKVA